jgi:hypothetical protein
LVSNYSHIFTLHPQTCCVTTSLWSPRSLQCCSPPGTPGLCLLTPVLLQPGSPGLGGQTSLQGREDGGALQGLLTRPVQQDLPLLRGGQVAHCPCSLSPPVPGTRSLSSLSRRDPAGAERRVPLTWLWLSCWLGRQHSSIGRCSQQLSDNTATQ